MYFLNDPALSCEKVLWIGVYTEWFDFISFHPLNGCASPCFHVILIVEEMRKTSPFSSYIWGKPGVSSGVLSFYEHVTFPALFFREKGSFDEKI